MDFLWHQCSALFSTHFPMTLSVLAAGLMGSIHHCSLMCSPLVAAQMLELKTNQRSQTPMWFFHGGRITTYMLLGLMAVFATAWWAGGSLIPLANTMLLLAGIVFIVSAIKPRKTHACHSKTHRLQRSIDRLANPKLVYYLRGLLMGFMPCGLIVAALLLVATLSPLQAMMLMFLFGLSTTPVLQLAGLGALSMHHHFPQSTAKAGRSVMAMNGLFLCGLGLNLVSVN